MRRNKIPFSWKVEEYAFGAVALKNEIKRHREAEEEPWPLFKAVGIRALYVYTYAATIVLVVIGSIRQQLSLIFNRK